MLVISPKTIYHNLGLLEQVDSTTSAYYREMAKKPWQIQI